MSLIAELQRRNVFRVAIAYVAVSWLVLQVAALVFQAMEVPNSVLRGLLALCVVGFIPAMVFAWLYELTPEGLKRESEVAAGESTTRVTGRKIDRLVIGVLVAVVALLLLDKFVLTPGEKGTEVVKSADQAGSTGSKPDSPTSVPFSDASIAVLPFLDLSQAKDQEYFSDGLSEELLNLLAKTPELRVIARTSSFSFRGKDADVATIAKTLNVANVLEGSVRKSGNTLRVTAQLIRAADSSHLWSETYDRELTDIFKVQDEIAAAVVAALKLKLLASSPEANAHRTANLEAYDQFLLGRKYFLRSNAEGFRLSEAAFKRALALDPGYGGAWAGLAQAHAKLSDHTGSAEAVAAMKREAMEEAERAVSLAPGDADAYVARGIVRASTRWDWSGAEADFDKALTLDPGNTQALRHRAAMQGYLGRYPEAIAELRRCIELDPLSDGNWVELGGLLLASEGTAAARQALSRAAALNPESSSAWVRLGLTELLDRRFEDARRAFASAGQDWIPYGDALVEHALGHADASQAALDTFVRAEAHGSAYQIAQIHAWRGEPDRAFEWLERATVQRDDAMRLVKRDVLLQPLRGDPRYAEILKKVGLPP